MAFKTLAALALAAGLTQVSATCQRPSQTVDGFSFSLSDSSFPNTNNKAVQLRPSKTGDFSYVAIDNSSPALKANFQNGVIYAVDAKSHVATGATAYLSNFQIDTSVNPPTTVGAMAFANVENVLNATDPNWILDADTATDYSLWRNVPANTYSGMQICQADFDLNADGTPWYYFQYVNWVSKFPENCEFVAFVAALDKTDSNSC